MSGAAQARGGGAGERVCHCGLPATYGPPDLCREHALVKLDQLIAACKERPAMAQSSARWRLEEERARLLAGGAR